MTFSLITLFPEVFSPVFNVSMAKRARETKHMEIRTINLREFGIGRHRIVDDKPYGGGVGMVLRVDVLDRAIESARIGIPSEKVILLDPKGIKYTQEVAEDLSHIEHIILVCGHYEGYDERIRDLVDMEISIGDYVLSGGEIPAMVIMDSIMRLLPGVLKNQEAHELESFSRLPFQGKKGIEIKRILETSQYTRPEAYKGKVVPPILLSGDQKKIEEFRKSEATKMTKKRRPDLLKIRK